jgi:ParB family transcriptional regulator, chromosome partitioning protein
MAEQDDVEIKVIKTEKIPIEKIQLSNLQARQSKVTKGLDIFAEQIRNVGLIQPVVVYPVGDKFELIVGQRRYYAHKDVLQWTEILAMIIEKPKDEMMTTTISWLENEARQKMSNADTMRHVANLYGDKTSKKDIAKILGIPYRTVDACIGLPKVPDVVRDAVEKGEIEPVIAIRATTAKGFEKYESSEEKGDDVLDLAKQMAQNQLTQKEVTNIVDYGSENPDTDNETLITDGIKNVTESIPVDLGASDMKRLERYADNNELKSKSAAAAQLVLDGLDQSGD